MQSCVNRNPLTWKKKYSCISHGWNMIRGSYCHRTGYYKGFCIELIPKRCFCSLGGVPPSREHLEKTVLQRHSPRVSTLFLRIYSSGQAKDVRPTPGSSLSNHMAIPMLAGSIVPGLHTGFDSSDATVCGPFHILSFSFLRHKQVLQRWGFQNTAKDAEGTEKLRLVYPASQFNGSSNADLLKTMWNLER